MKKTRLNQERKFLVRIAMRSRNFLFALLGFSFAIFLLGPVARGQDGEELTLPFVRATIERHGRALEIMLFSDPPLPLEARMRGNRLTFAGEQPFTLGEDQTKEIMKQYGDLVESVYFSKDGTALSFEMKNGPYVFNPQGVDGGTGAVLMVGDEQAKTDGAAENTQAAAAAGDLSGTSYSGATAEQKPAEEISAEEKSENEAETNAAASAVEQPKEEELSRTEEGERKNADALADEEKKQAEAEAPKDQNLEETAEQIPETAENKTLPHPVESENESLVSEQKPAFVPVPEEDKNTAPDTLLGTLEFNWQRSVPAAVFRRGMVVWVVFNQDGDFDLRELRKKNENLIKKVERVPNRLHTILRFSLSRPAMPKVLQRQNDWIVEFYPLRTELLEQLEVRINYNKLSGGSVFVPLRNAGKMLRVLDPEIGDELVILPVFQEGMGLQDRYRQVDFELLPSQQGVVAQLYSDGVSVELQKYGIQFVGPVQRLTKSLAVGGDGADSESPTSGAALSAAQEQKEEGLFRFRSWTKIKDQEEFAETSRDMERDVVMAKTDARNRKRLDLARFYLANQLVAESLAVSSVIEQQIDTNVAIYDVLAIKGASQYLMARYEEAYKTFERIDVSKLSPVQQAEVQFWKNAAQLQQSAALKLDRLLMGKTAYASAFRSKEEEKEKDTAEKREAARLILETSSRLLKLIRKIDPSLANSEEVETLDATASFVARHYQELLDVQPSPADGKNDKNDKEEKVADVSTEDVNKRVKWWWAGADLPNQVKLNTNFLSYAEGFLNLYPDYLFNDFALVALDERLRKSDLDAAEKILSKLRTDERPEFANSVSYFRGIFNAKDENEEGAIAEWEKVAKDPLDRKNRARAQFALANYLTQQHRIERKETIKRLNDLRMAWRGDVIELNVMRQLGELYIEDKQFMAGFKVWRELISSFPGSEEALATARKMGELFIAIFNRGEVPKEVSQLNVLTLYYEFRELTPIGQQGDEMIQKLAERLVNLDLLDRAAALLTHQVRFRLSGEEKDRVSTRLAEIHLMNRKPKLALEVLRATDSSRLENQPERAIYRRKLKAKALLAMDRLEEVLDMVQGDLSLESAFLRADVHWQRKEWAGVVEALESPFRRIYREDRILSVAESTQIVRLAVAYTLLKKQDKLQRLRRDFIDYLPDEARKHLFEFVATADNALDINDLQGSLRLDQMEKFLSSYIANKNNKKIWQENQ